MTEPANHFYEFGPFRVDAVRRLLFRGGGTVPLTPKVFDVLLLLVQNSGRVLEKDELMVSIWPDTNVEERNLTQHVSTLRKVLGEGPHEHHYIATVPGRGYRFVASVNEVWNEGTSGRISKKDVVSRITIDGDEAGKLGEKVRLGGRVQLPSLALSPHWGARFAGSILLVTLSAAGFYFWTYRESKHEQTSVGVRSIAVLPFKSLPAAGSDEFMGVGMADALITKLSNIRHITVRPTSAVLKYTDSEQDPIAAGRELGVGSLLYGSVQRSDNRIRVTVQLVGVSDGTPLWADKFDEPFTSIFTVQDLISARVAQALLLKLTSDEQGRLVKRYTENTDAYQLYLKGRYFLYRMTADGFKKAIEHFNQAIAIDPNYALAHNGLAEAYYNMADVQLPPNEVMPKAKTAAIKALEIDDTLAEAHVTLACVKAFYDWDWQNAEIEFKRAIQINDELAAAHDFYGWYLASLGRRDEGIAELRRAQQLDPLSSVITTDLGVAFYLARQYDEAIEEYRKAIELDPNYWPAHNFLAWVYVQKSEVSQAVAELSQARQLDDTPVVLADLGHLYAVSGKRAEAKHILDKLLGQSKRRYVPSYHIAMVYVGLGEKDLAFEWLEKAYGERVLGLSYWVKVEPRLDSLRSDQRFQRLLQRMHLAP